MFSDMTEINKTIPENSEVKLSNRTVTLTWTACYVPQQLMTCIRRDVQSGPKISSNTYDDDHSS